MKCSILIFFIRIYQKIIKLLPDIIYIKTLTYFFFVKQL